MVYLILDIGLYDTTEYLIVNFIGAVVCSLLGLIYVKKRKFNKFTHQFVPSVVIMKEDEKGINYFSKTKFWS